MLACAKFTQTFSLSLSVCLSVFLKNIISFVLIKCLCKSFSMLYLSGSVQDKNVHKIDTQLVTQPELFNLE